MPKFSYTNTKNKDLLYAVKVPIMDDFFYLETDDKNYIFLDHREFGVFKDKNKNPKIEPVLFNTVLEEAQKIEGNHSLVHKAALHILTSLGVHNEKISVPRYFPLDMADFLRSKGVTFDIQTRFYPARAIKAPWEVDAIRESLRKTCLAFKKIEEILHDSEIQGGLLMYKGVTLTSEMVKKEVEEILFREGMFNVEGIIISCGKDAAIPHHEGNGPLYAHQTIVCDIFPSSKHTGYFADMTRTYVKGKPSARVQAMYEAVKKAQDIAFAMIKPGVVAKDVHLACSESLLKSGFDVGSKGFVHGTGHGLGLDVHEEPSVGRGSETVLASGHVITVEPGLYYEEDGGVRIEDVVCVMEHGHENLTNYPRKLVIE